jgi:hypothetical protein
VDARELSNEVAVGMGTQKVSISAMASIARNPRNSFLSQNQRFSNAADESDLRRILGGMRWTH